MAYSSPSTFGYVRRGILVISALLVLAAAFFGAYQWKTYHRNLAVNDANFPPFPALTKQDRILILSPHPDDETLGAGGLMAKATTLGIPVRVVFLTNGDGSLATRLVQDASFIEQMAKGQDPKRPRNVYQQIALMRQKEALAALAKLHIPAKEVSFLGYPDGGTKSMWETNWTAADPYRSSYTKTDHSPYANSWTPKATYCGQQVLRDLEQIITNFKPTIAITTNPYDTHPDHWAANAFLGAAISQLQLQQKYFSQAQGIKRYTFVVHHGLWPAPHGFHPDADLSPPAALTQLGISWMQSSLDTKSESEKTEALQQYKSQLATTPQFLRGFLRRNELFAQGKTLGQDTSSWQAVIQDPRNDLLLPQLVSAADIARISVKNDAGKVLLINISLLSKPWVDLKYVITLHTVTSQKIFLRKIVVSAVNKHHWQGLITSGGHSATVKIATVNVDNDQLIVRIPFTLLAPNQHIPSTRLISAATVFHQRILDQTPTAIVQLLPE
jgi:LmbE family N-acetylglucosaminyl deacetylase